MGIIILYQERYEIKRKEHKMLKFLEVFFGLLAIVGTLMTMIPMTFVSMVSWFVLLTTKKVKTVGSWLSFIGMVAVFIISLVK